MSKSMFLEMCLSDKLVLQAANLAAWSKSMFSEMGLSWSPLSITSTVAFDFLEKFGIWCHRRLVEEMRIMDIEAMKREAEENQTSGENQYSSSLSAPTAGRRKPSQEVAKKIAKAAGVKSKSMCLPRHSALATLHFWQDLLLG